MSETTPGGDLPRSWETSELLEVKEAPNRSPSAAPQPKVMASAGGAGLGGAIAALIVWGLQAAGIAVPVEAAMAISTISGILAGFVAGYLTPPRSM